MTPEEGRKRDRIKKAIKARLEEYFHKHPIRGARSDEYRKTGGRTSPNSFKEVR